MATQRRNELLTRIGPGTPMGRLIRQFWLPAMKSDELAADAPPVRLMLMGEQLIGFRDTSGRVGIMDHRCPHRGASLFFGRNEEDGIRCVYHGWKYDVGGKCLEQMNVPAHQDFRDKIRAKTYRTREQNGLVWVFMGDSESPPALPPLEAALIPGDQVTIDFTQRECNWLQALEGELDTSHVGVLHFGAVKAGDLAKVFEGEEALVINRAPEYVSEQTDYGYMYAAYRAADEASTYWRFGQFLFPVWTMPPINSMQHNIIARGYVPMDDTHTMVVTIIPKGFFGRREGSHEVAGATVTYPHLPNTTDWYGRFRLKANAGNDYQIDRERQRTQSFTGIEGIQLQDQAVTESMGPISDRTLEHLAPSDVMIMRTRRILIEAAEAFSKDGTLPLCAEHPDVYGGVRGGHFTVPKEAPWKAAYQDQLARHPLQ